MHSTMSTQRSGRYSMGGSTTCLFSGALAAVGMLSIGSAAALATGKNAGPGLPTRATVTETQSHDDRRIDIWAVVNADGTLARGEHTVRAFRAATDVPGVY